MSIITTVQNQLFNPCVQTYSTLRCKKSAWGGLDTDFSALGFLRIGNRAKELCCRACVFSMFRSMISQEHVRYGCSVIVLEDGPGNYDFEKSMLFGWVVFFNAWFNTVLVFLRKIEQLRVCVYEISRSTWVEVSGWGVEQAVSVRRSTGLWFR